MGAGISPDSSGLNESQDQQKTDTGDSPVDPVFMFRMRRSALGLLRFHRRGRLGFSTARKSRSRASAGESRPPGPDGPPAIRARGLIGRLEIPRLGLSAILIEGDDPKTLRRAVGHIPGTPLPGQPGNVALTGHRDTFFRPLRNIRANDVIVVTTLQGEYRYRVVSTRVVSPENIAVLNSSGGEILTLVTCYPFYFVGAAPDRFIVRAERLAG